MATIIKKIKSGRPYYYAVESARVEGKPRIVWQKYLGTLESIVEQADRAKPPRPKEMVIFQFGAVAALYRITQILGLVETIDRHFPKRNQGPSIGQYIVLAAINRAIDPLSKVKIGPWYGKTILQRIFRHPVGAFSSQRFWDAMEAIDVGQIPRIEEEIIRRAVDTFGVTSDYLLYDATNFFTFIDTFNQRCQLAQRGRNKAGRHDLRQIGLALLVTNECHIPVMHTVYEGNLTDSTVFGRVTGRLARVMEMLRSSPDQVTIVFDKGNISSDNLERIQRERLSFVAALTSAHHKELLTVPLSDYRVTSTRLPGIKSYRTSREVFGRQCIVVVKFSERFYTRQLANFSVTITSCTNRLHSLSRDLLDWQEGRKKRGRKPTVASVQKRVQEILKAQHMKHVFDISIDRKKGLPVLTFSTNPESIREITEGFFGKTILATDREDWSDEAIIQAYHGQNEIEQAFRDMKEPVYLRWQPMGHWTDQKIHVHAFYCVLALLLTGLTRYRLRQAGLDLSVEKMLDQLSDIQEVALLYPKGKSVRPRVHFTLSKMNSLQKKMTQILELDRFHPEKG
jgi:transposase